MWLCIETCFSVLKANPKSLGTLLNRYFLKARLAFLPSYSVQGLKLKIPSLKSGMPTGSHKKRGTTGRLTRDSELPLPVRSFKDPPPILSEIISSDLEESQESIFWCKKRGFPPFGGRLVSLLQCWGGWLAQSLSVTE